MKTDLHIHTQASDGTWTPLQLIEKVQQAGIGLFAVADHDNLENSIACAALLPPSHMQMVRAVEISATWNGSYLHILAYGVDPQNGELKQLLCGNQQASAAAQTASLEVLRRAGFPVDLTAFQAYRHDPSRGGWRMLSFLMDHGFCSGLEDFFGGLFNSRRPLIQPVFPSPEQVIATIKRAGGTPVLAHPGGYRYTISDEQIAFLTDVGLSGMECHSPYHDQAATRRFLDLCHDRRLLITGGSDCHGDFVPQRRLGKPSIDSRDLNLGTILEAEPRPVRH